MSLPFRLGYCLPDPPDPLYDWKRFLLDPERSRAGFIFQPLIQWGKKVFSQPPIVHVLPLKKMREACNFHHRCTSTMIDKIRKKNPENHIVGFLKKLFANYGGK